MAKGIEIGVAVDTKAAKQGIETGLIAPLEDAQAALEELGSTGGPEKLERGLEGAQQATEELEAETKDAARTIEREFKESYRKLKDSSDDATRSAKRNLDDVKSEAGSTARESAASFDGSAESIVDAFQEVAANAFVGLGPAAAVAGAAAAIGIGVAGAAFASNEQAANEMAEATSNAFDRMIEAGGNYFTVQQQQKALQDALNDADTYQRILDITKATGLAAADVTKAVALGGEAYADVLEKLEDARKAIAAALADGYLTEEAYTLQNSALVDQIAYLNGINEATNTANDKLAIYDQATGNILANRQQEQETLQKINKSVADLPSSKTLTIDGDVSALGAKLDGLFSKTYTIKTSIGNGTVPAALQVFGKPVP